MDDSFSAMAESQFLSFLVRRPWPKTSFSHFLHFGHGRNAFFYCFLPVGHGRKSIFGIFRSSAAAETQNLPIFDFPPRLKWYFYRFLDFIHGWRAFFCVLCVSLMSEMLFSVFFARRLQAKRCFLCFPLVAYKRNAVFGNFCISLTSGINGTPIVLSKSGEVNVYLVCWHPKNLLNSASGRERSCFFGQGG